MITKTSSDLTIDKFFGLNLMGDSKIKLGESPSMKNFYITQNNSLTKIEGYKQIMSSVSSTKRIQGMWYGLINNINHFLFACNGHIYKISETYWKAPEDYDENDFTTHCTDLGTLTDAETKFFEFNNNVYILNGYEYYKWNGSGTISIVDGYIPKIATGTLPSGGGTTLEEVNQLTGKKRQGFVPDGTSRTFYVREQSLDSIDYVYVNNTLVTSYTKNIGNGSITFTTAPAKSSTGADTVEIQWTKSHTLRNNIVKNRDFCLFGVAGDNRVFLYGNSNAKNVTVYSGLANKIASVEYFPATNFNNIGSSNYSITDITKEYKRLVITTNKPDAYYSYYDAITSVADDGTTTNIVSFPVFPLHSTKGNIAFGQGQIVNDNPITINNGELTEWVNTGTSSGETTNKKTFSEKIRKGLTQLDLTLAKTVVIPHRTEYWISVNDIVYIYNYYNGCFSKLDLEDVPTCYIVIDNLLFFGTENGKIMRFSSDYTSFNGVVISSHWEMNDYDFGIAYKKKTISKMWVSMLPQVSSSARISFLTDKNNDANYQDIGYKTLTFDDVDFSNFIFALLLNPQPFLIKLKAKNFTYFKLTIDNNSLTETATILSLSFRFKNGSEVR